MVPNSSRPTLDRGMGCLVALHRYNDGELWLLRKHPNADSWITVRKATQQDADAMMMCAKIPFEPLVRRGIIARLWFILNNPVTARYRLFLLRQEYRTCRTAVINWFKGKQL